MSKKLILGASYLIYVGERKSEVSDSTMRQNFRNCILENGIVKNFQYYKNRHTSAFVKLVLYAIATKQEMKYKLIRENKYVFLTAKKDVLTYTGVLPKNGIICVDLNIKNRDKLYHISTNGDVTNILRKCDEEITIEEVLDCATLHKCDVCDMTLKLLS